MRHFKKTIFLLLVQFIFLPLSAKSLDWEKIEVNAHLTKEGILEVEEIQAIRFDGDWNGGYRDYKVSYGQTLTLQGIERKSDSMEWVSLKEGNLDLLDHYAYYKEDKHLRWRSRQITDPPFENKIIEYRIRVRYEGILSRNWNEEFTLNHDFAFSERDGGIKKIHLELTWDSAWQLANTGDSKLVFDSENILPGKGFVKEVKFHYNSADTSNLPDSLWKRLGIRFLYLFIIPIILLALQFLIYFYCVGKGVFAKPQELKDWDEFKKQLGNFTPEEIAILSEKGLVEAWMTRLILEKKIRVIKNENLRIERLVPISEFSERDQKIIKELFIEDKSSVTSKEIKEYYKKKDSSFSLFSSIQSRIEKELEQKGILVPEKESRILNFLFWITDKTFLLIVFFFGSVLSIIFLYMKFINPFFSENGIAGGVVALSVFFSFFSSMFVSFLEDKHYGFSDLEYNRKDYFYTRYYRSLIPAITFAICYLWILEMDFTFLIGIIAVSILMGLLHLYRYSPHHFLKQIQISLNALSLKNFFSHKLLFDEKCDISVEWTPYLAAMDLAFSVKYRNDKKGDCAYLLPQSLENIFQRKQGANSDLAENNDSSSDSFLSSESSNFSEGAGTFGGAGASASWDDMSSFSSDSRYTSSSESSSSSSSSSSSGGGGGGGW